MKILLTGANGYIGMRLIPSLLESGHDIVCAVRSADRLSVDKETKAKLQIVEIDFLKEPNPDILPKDIDVAYYLIHSMTASTKDFDDKEAQAARNFNAYVAPTSIEQVIFLTGMNKEGEMSKHLESRQNVAQILREEGDFQLTCLQAAIIVGSGSSSFEIIRDLCEKLPVMITPEWVKTKTQPISIRDVLKYLTGVLGRKECYGKDYDISGPEILTYKKMMQQYARIRKLNLSIVNVPVMTPRLSSYWLYFVTSTSYKLAVNLVDSMTVEVLSKNNDLQNMLGIEPLTYAEAIRAAFDKIEQNNVVSSWKDSIASGRVKQNINKYIQVPTHGCQKDVKVFPTSNPAKTLHKIWSIGGDTGWYYANTLWKIRGFLDKLLGGVGLRRGRTHETEIYKGDSLDFWRVILADKEERRLLLFAEMKLPGEAWLEFHLDEQDNLHQVATFRPRGLFGRLYWYSMLPFHIFIFKGMAKRIAKS